MKKIDVYTTIRCGYCVMAKRLLDSLELSYEEIDVAMMPRSDTGSLNPLVNAPFANLHRRSSVGGYTELAASTGLGSWMPWCGVIETGLRVTTPANQAKLGSWNGLSLTPRRCTVHHRPDRLRAVVPDDGAVFWGCSESLTQTEHLSFDSIGGGNVMHLNRFLSDSLIVVLWLNHRRLYGTRTRH